MYRGSDESDQRREAAADAAELDSFAKAVKSPPRRNWKTLFVVLGIALGGVLLLGMVAILAIILYLRAIFPEERTDDPCWEFPLEDGGKIRQCDPMRGH